MKYKIEELNREKWQGFLLPFDYISQNYYDVEIKQNDSGFRVDFVKKPFETPFQKTPHDSDRLFQFYRDEVRVWGVVEKGELLAALETSVEGWNNRLIVTELWVHTDHRRKGIATALMNKAFERAREEKRRMVVLETQSNNEGAINFYLGYGFMLTGFDAYAYQNNDIKRHEVRLDFGMLL